jgi:hypothetical protein
MPRERRRQPADIRTLEQKLARTQRALRRAQARQKKQARADDARGKIIIGAFCKQHALRYPGSAIRHTVRWGIERHLALRPSDRYLFVEVLALLEDKPPGS